MTSPSPTPSPARPDPGDLPVSFAQFVVSLGSSALVHLGEIPDPGTGEAIQDKALARQTIAVLEMLHQKTKGNLDEDEARLIEALLTDLRTKLAAG